jgi:hypothetical protein
VSSSDPQPLHCLRAEHSKKAGSELTQVMQACQVQVVAAGYCTHGVLEVHTSLQTRDRNYHVSMS